MGSVIAELRQGLKTPQEADNLCELLNIITYVDVKNDDWRTTGLLLGKLRRSGTVPWTDALIAVVVKNNNCNVLTIDQHFKQMSKFIGCNSVTEVSLFLCCSKRRILLRSIGSHPGGL